MKGARQSLAILFPVLAHTNIEDYYMDIKQTDFTTLTSDDPITFFDNEKLLKMELNLSE